MEETAPDADSSHPGRSRYDGARGQRPWEPRGGRNPFSWRQPKGPLNREKLDLAGREGGWPQQGRSRQRLESREPGAIPGGPQSSQVCLEP